MRHLLMFNVTKWPINIDSIEVAKEVLVDLPIRNLKGEFVGTVCDCIHFGEMDGQKFVSVVLKGQHLETYLLKKGNQVSVSLVTKKMK